MRKPLHLICTLNIQTGMHVIETPEGKIIVSKMPDTIYTAHREAWVSLQREFGELDGRDE